MPSFVFFTASLTLFKSTGVVSNLSISNLSNSKFKLAKSTFLGNCDVPLFVAFFKSTFVA